MITCYMEISLVTLILPENHVFQRTHVYYHQHEPMTDRSLVELLNQGGVNVNILFQAYSSTEMQIYKNKKRKTIHKNIFKGCWGSSQSFPCYVKKGQT